MDELRMRTYKWRLGWSCGSLSAELRSEKNLMERKTQPENCMKGQIYAWLKYRNTWNIVSFHFSLIRMTKLSPPLIRAIINGKIIFFVWLYKSETHENFRSLRHCHKGLESGSQNKVAFDTKLFKDNETSLCFFRKNPHDRIFYNAKDGHSIFH